MAADLKATVVRAADLTPGMSFGRRRTIASVTKADGMVEVTYTSPSGHTNRFPELQQCLVWSPVPDWEALARDWRAVAYAMAPYLTAREQGGLALEPLEARWPG